MPDVCVTPDVLATKAINQRQHSTNEERLLKTADEEWEETRRKGVDWKGIKSIMLKTDSTVVILICLLVNLMRHTRASYWPLTWGIWQKWEVLNKSRRMCAWQVQVVFLTVIWNVHSLHAPWLFWMPGWVCSSQHTHPVQRQPIVSSSPLDKCSPLWSRNYAFYFKFSITPTHSCIYEGQLSGMCRSCLRFSACDALVCTTKQDFGLYVPDFPVMLFVSHSYCRRVQFMSLLLCNIEISK